MIYKFIQIFFGKRYNFGEENMVFGNADELESDTEVRKLFNSKTKKIKPKFNLELNVEKEYGTSESSLTEHNSREINSSFISEDEKEYIEEKPISLKYNESSIKPNKQERKGKFTLSFDEFLPKEDQGLPEKQKLKILNEKDEMYYQILEMKKIVENSENVLREYKDMEEKKGRSVPGYTKVDNSKRIVSFDQILEFLKENNSSQSIQKYIGANTFLLRDIIFYVNEYKTSDEPKLTEKSINERFFIIVFIIFFY